MAWYSKINNNKRSKNNSYGEVDELLQHKVQEDKYVEPQ
jgi:hypothetical protein